MAVPFPSNVLIISDYEKYRFNEKIPYRIDFILSLGDNVMEALKAIHERYQKPIFAVRGNHCGLTPFPKGVIDVHLNIQEYRQWRIGGLGGTLYYKDKGHNMWSDHEAQAWLDPMPRCDIFICHNPVAGVTGSPGDYAHQGSEAIRTYITEKQPKMVFHGHIHKNLGGEIGATGIVSVYGHKLIHL